MPVDAPKKRGMPAGHRIEVLPARQLLASPQRMVPVAAGQPGPRRCRPGRGLHLIPHRLERRHTRQVDVPLGPPRSAQVGMRIVEPGKYRHAGLGCLSQVPHHGLFLRQPFDLGIGPHGQHLAAAHGHRLHHARLILGQHFAGVDACVDQDDLRCRGVRAIRSVGLVQSARRGRLCGTYRRQNE